ncbi:MAG: thioredoxin domain-containing protein [Rothia sp. (in: high G+C Gram-positive bacteria)]|uniref:DsbA family protein n=1 Tax=Rothia sp. (in: high G+C Gram-positive bacteria) TaxID=1885016 RepID=UPI0026E0ED4B|nr:thioredoxin domain-containing protein [Rothia sp. (in: high G+C Gram-positive bacteria)]MDO5751006.1 thioredoxin domain-containing protein [Rothia sp. (in: high G+C Gram-positive bacteria)]
MSTDAREKARQLAAKQAKNNTAASSRRWIQLTVLLVVAALVAVFAFVFYQNQNSKIPNSGPVPASANQYGGIVLTKDGIVKNASSEQTRNLEALGTSTVSINPTLNGTPDATAHALPLGMQNAEESAKNGQAVRVTVFQDFNCIHCREFEERYGEEIQKLVEDGTITLEVRNLIFLDRVSPTQYSSRTANAAYAVANQVSTTQYLNFQRELFTYQGKKDLTNQEIADIASKYGADISSDLNENKWRPLVDVLNTESVNNGIAGTPTVFVDGDQYTGSDFSAFLKQKIDAKKK